MNTLTTTIQHFGCNIINSNSEIFREYKVYTIKKLLLNWEDIVKYRTKPNGNENV